MKTLLVGVAVFTGIQLVSAPLGAQTPAGAAKQADRPITVTGCIQSEADYRAAQEKGRGGVAGTGVGVGNEFVLTSASAASGDKGASAYELTGTNEKLASAHVGHRVEVAGTLKAGSGTGGPTAGPPPSGLDVTSKDLQLPEIEVTTIKMIAADCVKK